MPLKRPWKTYPTRRWVRLTYLPHPLRQVALRGLHHDVVVVGHLTIGVADPVESIADLPEQVEPEFAVGVGEEDRAALVAAGGDVVKAAGKFYAKGACHQGFLSGSVSVSVR